MLGFSSIQWDSYWYINKGSYVSEDFGFSFLSFFFLFSKKKERRKKNKEKIKEPLATLESLWLRLLLIFLCKLQAEQLINWLNLDIYNKDTEQESNSIQPF